MRKHYIVPLAAYSLILLATTRQLSGSFWPGLVLVAVIWLIFAALTVDKGE